MERPMRRTETGVHRTMTEDISSTNTLGFGLTTATWVMTSGWSTKELMSWLCGGETLRWRGGRDGPVHVVPKEELVVDGYPHALYVGEEAHVGGDAGGWGGMSGGERGGRDALL